MLLFNCGHARALKTIAAFEEEFRSTSNLEREHEGGSQCIIAHGHVLPLYILTNLDRGGACLERIILFLSVIIASHPPRTPSQCAQMCVH